MDNSVILFLDLFLIGVELVRPTGVFEGKVALGGNKSERRV